MLSGRFTKFSKANLNHDLNNDNDQKGEGGVPCPFHKLELYEIGELPATRMLWSSSRRTF